MAQCAELSQSNTVTRESPEYSVCVTFGTDSEAGCMNQHGYIALGSLISIDDVSLCSHGVDQKAVYVGALAVEACEKFLSASGNVRFVGGREVAAPYMRMPWRKRARVTQSAQLLQMLFWRQGLIRTKGLGHGQKPEITVTRSRLPPSFGLGPWAVSGLIPST